MPGLHRPGVNGGVHVHVAVAVNVVDHDHDHANVLAPTWEALDA